MKQKPSGRLLRAVKELICIIESESIKRGHNPRKITITFGNPKPVK